MENEKAPANEVLGIVTTERQKNPGRQEWGRKLGKMSKELKLKKQQEEQVPHIQEHVKHVKVEYCLAAVTIVIAIAALYYQKKSFENQQVIVSTKQVKKSEFSDF